MASTWSWIADAGGVRVGVRTSRREQTTSTVIIAGDRAVLVDPAWDPDELALIAADVSGAGITVAAGFATHPHHDHLLWHPGLGEVPRWASAATAAVAAARRPALRDALGARWPPELGDLVGVVEPWTEDQVPWDGPDIMLITHHGHAPGHTALWVPAAGVLIAGDMLSDVELPLLEESTPADYDQGLSALEPYVAQATRVVPGHGSVAAGTSDAMSRWRADRSYLRGLRAGAASADPRLDQPGMRTADRQNRQRAELSPS